MIADHVGGAITYVSPEVRSKGVTTRLHNLARDAGLATEARREVQSQQNASIESKRDDGSADLATAPVEAAASLASPQLKELAEPFHGAAVSDQTRSAWRQVGKGWSRQLSAPRAPYHEKKTTKQ